MQEAYVINSTSGIFYSLLKWKFEEMKVYVKETDIIDFGNVYDDLTENGEKWSLIDQLIDQKDEDSIYLWNKINYETDFKVHMLEDINYPMYKLTRDQLIQMCSDVMISYGLHEFLHITRDELRKFFSLISWWYRKVPYHNFTHGVFLFWLMHWILTWT